jgi:fructoselysine-6-P-deglycase FrlB-like protein
MEMRKIKYEARELMKRLDELIGDEREGESPEAAQVRMLLGELRNRWEDYARNLETAHEQKMIFLGHRPGPA